MKVRMMASQRLIAHIWRRSATTGFTLIEMLVVFSLIAVLLTLAVPRYFHALDNAQEKARQQNLATLRDALDKFRADQGRYPNELTELTHKQYLRGIPLDPVSNSTAWVLLAHPTALESGIYDVAAPVAPGTVPGETPAAAAKNPEVGLPSQGLGIPPGRE